MDLLRDLELKEEDIGAGNLAVGRDEGWGELIVLDDEECEEVVEDEVEGEEIADHVVNSGEGEDGGRDKVVRPEEVVNPVHVEDMSVEDIAAAWLSEMGGTVDESFVEDGEDKEVEQDGGNCLGEGVNAGHGGDVNVELEEDCAVAGEYEVESISADHSLFEHVEDQAQWWKKFF